MARQTTHKPYYMSQRTVNEAFGIIYLDHTRLLLKSTYYASPIKSAWELSL